MRLTTRRCRHLGIGLAVAVWAGPGPARSVWAASTDDPTPVVAGELVVEGTLTDYWRGEITKGLRRGLQRANLEPVAASDPDCQELSCLRERATEESAAAVIVVAIAAEDRFYRVQLVAYDSRASAKPDATPLASVEEECPICGPGEVAALVERQAAVLGRKIPTSSPPGLLVVTTVPSGARIEVDGQAIGNAPLQIELSPGRHIVRASAEGHEPLERTVTAVAQVKESWSANLRAVDPPLSTRQIQFRTAGWVLLGTAAATTVPAIVFVALDRRPFPLSCSGDMVDADGDCERVYRTLPHGGAFLGVAVALATTGSILVGLSRRKSYRSTSRARRRRQSPRFSARGMGLGVEF